MLKIWNVLTGTWEELKGYDTIDDLNSKDFKIESSNGLVNNNILITTYTITDKYQKKCEIKEIIEKKEVQEITLFDNGNILVFDNKGNQISALQENPIIRVFKEAKKLGYKLDDDMVINLPIGQAEKANEEDNYYIHQKK